MQLFAMIILLLLCWSCDESKSSGEAPTSPISQAVVAPAPTPDPVSPDATTAEFMELLNAHRSKLGLEPLKLVEEISVLVEDHSSDMALGKISFGHAGFSDRCDEARLIMDGGNWCGENVASGQRTALAAFTAWMNSSGHRANMESSRATHTGFGYARSDSGTIYWTQLFLELN